MFPQIRARASTNVSNEHFYFLPPTVTPYPSYSGFFDPALSPAVQIWELSEDGNETAMLVEYDKYTSSILIEVNSVEEYYGVDWPTEDFNLDDQINYRINVYVDGQRFGYADIDVVNSGKEIKNARSEENIPLLEHKKKLSIRFRIEEGADIYPPAQVTDFNATPALGQIALSWVNPTDIDFAGLVVRRSTSGYPTSPTEGIEVYSGTGNSYTDIGLTDGTTYYYAAFTYDEIPNYSLGVTISGAPLYFTHSVTTMQYAFSHSAQAVLNGKAYFFGGTVSDLVYIFDPTQLLGSQWSTDTVSVRRSSAAMAVLGDKLYIAGGDQGASRNHQSWIDIYDDSTGDWSTHELTIARMEFSATAVDGKVIFFSGSHTWSGATKRIDIYDSRTDTWSIDEASLARSFTMAVTVGDKAIFGGGATPAWAPSRAIDIYNATTGEWSTSNFTVAHSWTPAVAVGDLAIFAGGYTTGNGVTELVEIYNNRTDSWSTAVLSQARTHMGVTAVGDFAIFAGGFAGLGSSDVVDIYDASNDSWHTATLSTPRYGLSAVTIGNSAYFIGGINGMSVVDVFTLRP